MSGYGDGTYDGGTYGTLDVAPTGPTLPDVAADTLTLWGRLGFAADEDARAGGYQLLAWLDGIGSLIQTVDDLCRDSTDTAGNPAPGWSQILDVQRAPTYALPWLGQLAGVRVDTTLPAAAQRTQIQAEQGFARGTVAAITRAAQQYLTGSQTVTVSERTTDAYHLSVSVYAAQVIGQTYQALAAAYPSYSALTAAFAAYDQYASAGSALQAAVLAAVPAGLIATVQVLSGASYAVLTSSYSTYSALTAAFATYAAMTSYTP